MKKLAQLVGIPPCKYASRLALQFSSTVPVKTCNCCIRVIEDIKSADGKFEFTDGSGFLSTALTQEAAVVLGWTPGRSPPSAIQVHIDGIKGVQVQKPTLDHDPAGVNVEVRPSQTKFDSCSTTLEVISASQRNPAFLNQQIIVLLDAREVPQEHILKMHAEAVDNAAKIVSDPQVARYEINDTKVLSRSIGNHEAAFLLSEPFFRTILQWKYMQQIEHLACKTSIPVEKGALLLGVPDSSGLLREGEILLQVSPIRSEQYGKALQVINGQVMIAKNPCLHPGDILSVKAVERPEVVAALAHVRICVVFMTQGHRPLPDMTSGSDLDGDPFFVSWDERLLPVSECEPMDYSENVATATGAAAAGNVGGLAGLTEFPKRKTEETIAKETTVASLMQMAWDLKQDHGQEVLNHEKFTRI